MMLVLEVAGVFEFLLHFLLTYQFCSYTFFKTPP